MKKNIFNKIILSIVVGVFCVNNLKAQNVTGSGTNNYIIKWTSTGSTAGNSVMQESSSNVGIGVSPSYKLDVSGGDINTASSGSAYRIQGNKMLWYNGTATSNLFAGVGAANGITTGLYNTFMGYWAGYNNNTGNAGTFIGYDAGYTNTKGYGNTAVGYEALKFNDTTYGNCAFGYRAAMSNIEGCGMTAMGENALKNGTTGTENVGVGSGAGAFNVTGDYNTYVGSHAGNGVSTNSHSFNSFFGADAGKGITTGGSNLFSGYQSGFSSTTASGNTFSGGHSGYSTTTGTYNVVTGDSAFYFSATGGSNTIAGFKAGFGNSGISYTEASLFGYKAGYTNKANYNTFIGTYSGYSNLIATYNTFVGYAAGYANNHSSNDTYNTFIGHNSGRFNTTGVYGAFLGHQSGYNNTTGYENTYIGLNSGYANTTGSYNAAVGKGAGDSFPADSNCTFLGYGADASANNLKNATAIGNGASVDSSNKVRIGNASVTSIGGQVGWTVFSDVRVKNNIQQNVKGLDFIKLLRPVTYHYDVDKENQLIGIAETTTDSLGNQIPGSNAQDKYDIEQIQFSGFIAQEVDSAAQKVGYNFSGVDKNGAIMGLRYSEFTVPLVKAIQELNATVDSLKATPIAKKAAQSNDSLRQEIEQLKALVNQCCSANPANQTGNNERQGNAIINEHQLELASSAILYQNSPNPFGDGTTIKYFVPDNANAQIIFYNEFGSTLKEFKVEEKGIGQLNISAMNLASGSYSYSLIINGKVVDTKKMMKVK